MQDPPGAGTEPEYVVVVVVAAGGESGDDGGGATRGGDDDDGAGATNGCFDIASVASTLVSWSTRCYLGW